MNIKCLFGLNHDFEKVREYDIKAALREGWSGNPGFIYWHVLTCQRDNCDKVKHQRIGRWHKLRYCPHCKRQTRQETYIFSDAGGHGTWYGQGDGYVGWDCIICGKTVKDIPDRAIDIQKRFMEGKR